MVNRGNRKVTGEKRDQLTATSMIGQELIALRISVTSMLSSTMELSSIVLEELTPIGVTLTRN